MAEKVVAYNEANRKVAILCNHQKTVSKAQEDGLAALADRLDLLKKQKKELGAILKALSRLEFDLLIAPADEDDE